MDREALRRQAEHAERSGQLREAVGHWLALEQYERAAALLLKLGDHKKAGTFFEMAGQPQKAIDALIAGKRYMHAALMCRQQGEERRASELQGRALAIDGKLEESIEHFMDAQAYHLAGSALAQLGRVDEAVEAFTRSGDWEDAARALAGAGRRGDAAALLERVGQATKAAEAFAELQRPLDAARCLNTAGRHFEAGRTALKAGDAEAALSYLSGVSTDAEDADKAALLRGQILDKRGDKRAAALAYADYLEGKPLDAQNKALFKHTVRLLEANQEGRRAWAIKSRLRAARKPQSSGPLDGVLAPDSRFANRFRLQARVAAGAAGTVYRAYDRAMHRQVAVKVLKQGFMPTQQARDMFVEEAKTVAKLVHPNIVAVFDIGVEDDPLCFSMEWVDGATLTDYVGDRGGCLPHHEVVDIAKQLADALNRAHREQIVHRDVKPDNAMITFDGVVKLADFGLARLLSADRDQGYSAGTPAFMSPEQIRNQSLSHLADVYSFACTIYGLYCGEPPFWDGDILAHHCNSPPPDIRRVAPWLSKEVSAVLTKGLAKAPTERWKSCVVMAKALAQCPPGQPMPKLGPPKKS